MLYSKIEGQGARAEGESSEAKPLLILHGFLGMSDNWKTLGAQYASEGFEVHMLDLRNHGRSFHSSEFSYEVMVKDISAYCMSHNLKKIDIIGHSMGGKVAMLFAATYPEKVNKLIVADIGPKYYKQHHQDILAGLNAVDFSLKPDRATVDGILKEHITDFGTRQFLMKSLYWQELGQLAFRFNLAVFNKEIEQIGVALPSNALFNNSTFFLRGGNSNYIKDEDFEDIKNHFPNALIETIPKVGHWLHAENPVAFYNKTIAFLREN